MGASKRQHSIEVMLIATAAVAVGTVLQIAMQSHNVRTAELLPLLSMDSSSAPSVFGSTCSAIAQMLKRLREWTRQLLQRSHPVAPSTHVQHSAGQFLTDPVRGRAQVSTPQVIVTSRRLNSRVMGSIVCDAQPEHAWRVVRDCLSGRSKGVLRSVDESRVLAADGNKSVLLEQRCHWNVGPIRGRSQLVHNVIILERKRRINFAMVKEDAMMKRFTGELEVRPSPAGGAIITICQDVEGQSHILSALAGLTVLRGMLRSQCAATLCDLATAANRSAQ
jgi:hypothetical protein